MTGLSRAIRVACLFLALSTCRATALPQRATLPQPSLTAQVFVTNESFVTRRLELRVNDVVVLDTVVDAEPALAHAKRDRIRASNSSRE